jgi:hypothetical protein
MKWVGIIQWMTGTEEDAHWTILKHGMDEITSKASNEMENCNVYSINNMTQGKNKFQG